ncbi:uncharacterized protein CLUP02_00906 [Colletotrichum lupini]|uniref:Uncharacterized protein n=1 Tax=Colletotrichum lupini TaxID=145971 RepID=A0A9Q8W818_9PEZI|nr:uncharacterized protein CLUP02_00906 [Colletotrichum lupini]UQC74258.1 hypothetical protein CLUP02_00906 [Colletotrichum lupini]
MHEYDIFFRIFRFYWIHSATLFFSLSNPHGWKQRGGAGKADTAFDGGFRLPSMTSISQRERGMDFSSQLDAFPEDLEPEARILHFFKRHARPTSLGFYMDSIFLLLFLPTPAVGCGEIINGRPKSTCEVRLTKGVCFSRNGRVDFGNIFTLVGFLKSRAGFFWAILHTCFNPLEIDTLSRLFDYCALGVWEARRGITPLLFSHSLAISWLDPPCRPEMAKGQDNDEGRLRKCDEKSLTSFGRCITYLSTWATRHWVDMARDQTSSLEWECAALTLRRDDDGIAKLD